MTGLQAHRVETDLHKAKVRVTRERERGQSPCGRNHREGCLKIAFCRLLNRASLACLVGLKPCAAVFVGSLSLIIIRFLNCMLDMLVVRTRG